MGATGDTRERCRRPLFLNLPNWLPPVWYLLGAVGVPLVNLIFQGRSSDFGEHCITVLAAVGCVWGVVMMVRK
jgi:hypothetical protein